jgi:surface antigen
MTPRFTLKGGILRPIAAALPVLGLSGCVVYEAPAPYDVPAASSSSNQSTASTGQTCREYRTTATIDGKPQEIHGTACLQPDGTWQFLH